MKKDTMDKPHGRLTRAPRSKSGDKAPAPVARENRSEAEWHAQLVEDRSGQADPDGPGSDPVGALSSANSVSADPFARKKALGEPVPQVTRHI